MNSAGLCTVRAVVIAIASTLMLSACQEDDPQLPALGVDISQTSVSGLSSGAYMAGQFHITHANSIVGAALVAGGPYGCAETIAGKSLPGPGAKFLNLGKAISGCMQYAMRLWGVPNPQLLAERLRERQSSGDVDPAAGLTGDRIYLFSGQHDKSVATEIVQAAKSFYRLAGIAEENIKLVTDTAGGHGFLTVREGVACQSTGAPYINNCGYDQAGEILKHLYGELTEPVMPDPKRLMAFNQSVFDGGGEHDTGLAASGLVYVPERCQRQTCRTHIVFHSCKQSAEQVGDEFAQKSGFLRWAEGNGIVVLFPQTRVSALNPNSCWDWWGYTGPDYLNRRGPQIAAVWQMLKRLASGARGT